jgi:hypothetical protein
MAGCERESNGVEGILPTPDTLVASVTLSIGRASGRDHEIVSRAFSGFRRANRIFVAHGAGPELRVYDLDGRLLSRAGREGSAPGEFRQLRWIAPLYPDSVLAFDGSLLRVSIFHDGSFARSFQLDVQGGQSGEWIGTHDDRITVAVTRMADPRSLQADQPVRDSLVIAFIPMDRRPPARRRSLRHRWVGASGTCAKLPRHSPYRQSKGALARWWPVAQVPWSSRQAMCLRS